MGETTDRLSVLGLWRQSAGRFGCPPTAWHQQQEGNVLTRYPILRPQTKHNYKYQDTDTEGHWYQVALDNEHERLHACSKTGDATVPYHSLSWAHTWLGEQGAFVNVTQVPQSVYFSAENIKQFKAVRKGDSHHAEYTMHSRKQPMCSTPTVVDGTTTGGFLEGFFKSPTLDQITFFERKTQVNGVTQSVWFVMRQRHCCHSPGIRSSALTLFDCLFGRLACGRSTVQVIEKS